MAIEWNESMSTGNQDIDEEHKEWVRRFNDFDASVMAGHGMETLQKTLEFMAEYAENHFVHEESLAWNLKSAAEELNRVEHERFREKIDYMRKWIRQDGASSVEVLSLKMDMEKWLVHHMCEVDVQLWPSK